MGFAIIVSPYNVGVTIGRLWFIKLCVVSSLLRYAQSTLSKPKNTFIDDLNIIFNVDDLSVIGLFGISHRFD